MDLFLNLSKALVFPNYLEKIGMLFVKFIGILTGYLIMIL